MTSPPPTDDGPDAPDTADDAVLAVLDGTATPEQRRRVARDPDLRARLGEQQAAIQALATPLDALDDATTTRMRARALDALTDSDPDSGPDEAANPAVDRGHRPVTPLPPRRTRPLPPWPAVAAAVILLMGIGLALIVNDRGGDDTAATGRTALDEPTEAERTAEEAARQLGDDAASGTLATTTAPSPAASAETEADQNEDTGPGAGDANALPRFTDEDALRQVLQGIDPATLQLAGATTSTASQNARAAEAATLCDQGLQEVESAFGPVQASLVVLMGDREVLVMSNPVAATADAPASTRLTVLDLRSCTPLFAVQR